MTIWEFWTRRMVRNLKWTLTAECVNMHVFTTCFCRPQVVKQISHCRRCCLCLLFLWSSYASLLYSELDQVLYLYFCAAVQQERKKISSLVWTELQRVKLKETFKITVNSGNLCNFPTITHTILRFSISSSCLKCLASTKNIFFCGILPACVH